MKQFRAGYIVDSVGTTLTNNFDTESIFSDSGSNSGEVNQLRGLLKNLSTFDVLFPQPQALDFDNIHPVLAVLANIVSRGLPTKAPVIIEEKFVEIGLIKPNNAQHELKFSVAEKQLDYETIFELLHIIEPGLIITQDNYGGSLGSHLEWQFIGEHPFLIQLLQSQRDFSTINLQIRGGRSVDFSFTSPYNYWNQNTNSFVDKTRIFEVDGPHHLMDEYVFYDSNRDIAAEAVEAATYRFTNNQITNHKVDFEKLISNSLYSNFEKNFNRIFSDYLREYSLLFIPIAVARIQKTILEFFIRNTELFRKQTLRIAIIERDIPGAALAIKSLEEYFNNMNAILELKNRLQLPTVELFIFQEDKWVLDQKINCGYEVKNETFFGSNDFDIIIDHSVLRRSNIIKENSYMLRDSIIVRSCHYVDNSISNSRKMYCSNLLDYKSLVKRNEDGSYSPITALESHINFFIQNIFRKKSFREGQLPIISRALQQKPVIGLLPTGGGKSLTFQLPAFLQPGLCLVVDPIKSLMEDQVRVLKESWIDCCQFINSTISREDKQKRIVDFRLGESLFFFVSPERFIMDDFRKVIRNIHGSNLGLAFSFCVIDEVHCVSEWGHDFRYTYLMLGKNSQIFCHTKSKERKVSLIGLTATASFDVLADIERELQIDHDDVANAIIMIENTIRPELFFKVIDVTNKSRIDVLNQETTNLSKRIAALNKPDKLQASQKHHYENFEPKDFQSIDPITGLHDFDYKDTFLLKDIDDKKFDDLFTITFCPVRGTKQNVAGEFINISGVRFVHANLNSESKGFYYASESDEESVEVQNHFRGFTGNHTHQMVCTKAFGMGIDKSDIRSTYHYYYSSSLESFIQECGRAGRDKKIALANILLDTSKYYVFDLLEFLKNYPVLNGFNRTCLRKNLESRWDETEKTSVPITFKSEQAFKEFVIQGTFSFNSQDGREFAINENNLATIKTNLLASLDLEKSLLVEKYKDRGIHDYFFKLSFRGLEYEKAQILHLINTPEFDNQPGLGHQGSLRNVFDNAQEGTFEFKINERKVYGIEQIKKMFFIKHNDQDELIKNTIRYATNFEDFIFKIDENRIRELQYITEENREELFTIFYRDRHKGDTGRIIYRLHSIGFLTDYTYDYNLRIYNATFIKHSSIDSYVAIIERYLRRYLSENSAISEIKKLKSKLSSKKEKLIDDIIEALYFISEFSYNEIVEKRKRATDEIEKTMLEMISHPGDDFEKNCYLKEEIYFYFNAKYARPQFKIGGKEYSLLDDHHAYRNNEFEPDQLVAKYLNHDLLKFGTEQNNYKHLIGSCKKILNSLPETDLKKEWALRLIKAFALYATNNASYRSEANLELENGFKRLFDDINYHQNAFSTINTIFKKYFDSLLQTVEEENASFLDIGLIKNKLLQQLQHKGITDLVNAFKILEDASI